MGRVTVRRPVLKVRLGDAGPTGARRADTLVAEEPLEIRVGGRSLAVTMRTPGDDIDLVHGFLTTEGVIRSAEDVSVARYCAGTDDDGMQTYNVIDVQLAPGVAPPDPSVDRNFFTSSSCGICGKASIDAVRVLSPYDVSTEDSVLDPAVVAGFPDVLRSAQKVFDRTGGLHAAGLFTVDGQLECLREDVGRHNAVDKVIGWALRQGRLPASGRVLMVSGRASFELTQKALLAGIPVLAAVSAPSSLAVDLAAESGMTLIGFLRGETMNVYSGLERIRLESPAAVAPGG